MTSTQSDHVRNGPKIGASLWAVKEVFITQADAHRACCGCCGFDCLVVHPDHHLPEVLIRSGGYVSDRYVMIQEDRMGNVPETVRFEISSMPTVFQVPATMPGPSKAFFVPSRAAKLLDLGLTIHQGTGPAAPQHLYDGDVHVGWIMGAKKGAFTVPQIRSVMAMLKRIDPGSPLYAAINHPQMPLIDGLALFRAAVPLFGEFAATAASASAQGHVADVLGLAPTGSRG